MTLVSKSFSEIVTFSRSSNATRVGPTGVLEYAPHNLLTYSQALATWPTGNGTYTNNAAAAPDGTVTATRCVATDADPYVYQSQTLIAQQYTLSVWVKAEGSAIGKNFSLRAVGLNQVFILTGSWQRVSVTFTASAGSQNVGFEAPESASVGDTVYFWGAQLSVGPYALDYTPTTSAAVYGPRFDYDPVTLAARGLLVEEQRTNLLQYSEQFDNAAWSKTEVTASANSTTAPDGQTNADTLTVSTVNSYHRVTQNIAGSTTGLTLTYSAYVKANGYNIVALRESSSIGAAAVFNLSGNGSVLGQYLTPTYVSGATITPVGNSWFRISAQFFNVSNQSIGIYVLNNWTSGDPQGISYAGDGTSGIYLWGAQVEAGSFATSYIPTLASTVTRSADVASVNTLSPWFNADQGAVYIEGTGAYAFQINAGSADSYNNFWIVGDISTALVDRYFSGNYNSVTQWESREFSTKALKMAFAYQANNVAGYYNGTLQFTDSSAVLPTGLNTAYISHARTGWVKRISYYPRRLTNAELQALTA